LNYFKGDLWAQQWHNIFEDIKPFKNKPLLDVTSNMIAKVLIDFLAFIDSEKFKKKSVLHLN
jgi:hypothetical protein